MVIFYRAASHQLLRGNEVAGFVAKYYSLGKLPEVFPVLSSDYDAGAQTNKSTHQLLFL